MLCIVWESLHSNRENLGNCIENPGKNVKENPATCYLGIVKIDQMVSIHIVNLALLKTLTSLSSKKKDYCFYSLKAKQIIEST